MAAPRPRLPKMRVKLIERRVSPIDRTGATPRPGVEECYPSPGADRRAGGRGRIVPWRRRRCLRRLDWITATALARALISALPADTGVWDWPICAAAAATRSRRRRARFRAYPQHPVADPGWGGCRKQLEQASRLTPTGTSWGCGSRRLQNEAEAAPRPPSSSKKRRFNRRGGIAAPSQEVAACPGGTAGDRTSVPLRPGTANRTCQPHHQRSRLVSVDRGLLLWRVR